MSLKPRLPRLLAWYEEYLTNQDSAAFVRNVSGAYTSGTLQRVACDSRRPVRRAAVLALGLLGNYAANHTLGRALLDADRMVRILADTAIRDVWARAGTPAECRDLDIIIRLAAAGLHEQAIRFATRLIESAPSFAEAWYQRGAAHFVQGRYVEAIRDCHQTLELNPYHFVAATSMGRAYLELGNPVSALESFRRALRVNPDLEAVRQQVVRLARMAEDK